MAVPTNVRPGDLITAVFFNDLLAEIASLEARLTLLEGTITPTGDIVISSINPPGTQAAPMRELNEVRIAGANFRLAVGAVRVFFDQTPVLNFKPGSNDSLLIFDVPNLPGNLPLAGQLVVLRVENGNSSTTRNVLVTPAVQDLQGDVDVIFRDDIPNPAPNPLAINQQALFAYRLRSRANLETSFQVTPSTSRTDLQPLLSVLDFNQNVIADGQIRLLPGEERSFFVRISSIPAAADNVTFTLTVAGESGAVVGGDGRPFTVGQVTQPQDPNIILGSPRFSATDSSGHDVPNASFDVATNTLRLPRGVQGALDFDVTFVNQGTYQITAVAGAGTTGWTIHAVPSSFIEQEANQQETPRLTARSNSTSSATGQINYTIKREGATLSQERRFDLQIM